ncbi:MAG TPA: hypothetical protein DCS13_07220 [Candidatus Margulisbacteria bacterium]|nr:hypothetical protein [Candidatus Margulisiibacteriota bacterium]HCY35702.1 hypothetical protein [Candidatus Margulisiibacteriota bacterium]
MSFVEINLLIGIINNIFEFIIGGVLMTIKFATSSKKGQDSYETAKECALEAMQKLEGQKPDFCIVFSSTHYDYAEVVKAFNEVSGNAPLIGASSAGEFTEMQVVTGGISCAMISSDQYKFFTGLGNNVKEDECAAILAAMKDFPSDVEGFPNLASIVLVDGLIGKGEDCTLALAGIMEDRIKVAGGAAGDDFKFSHTSVFNNDTIASNALSMGFVASKKPVVISVNHGHEPISPPLKITKSVDNLVYELDGKPAIEVWKDYTREAAKAVGIDVDKMWDEPDQLGRFTMIFEAGIDLGDSYKVRWSGIRPDTKDALPFVCSMPEGVVLRVMRSSNEQQFASAREAANVAVQKAAGQKIAGAIVFDCAVRSALLGEEFYKAIDEIKNILKCPIVGLATYGEIAFEPGQLSGFHNTTTVIMAFLE